MITSDSESTIPGGQGRAATSVGDQASAYRPLPLRSYMFKGLLPRYHGPRRSELTLYEQLTVLSWQFRVSDMSSPIAVRHPTVLECMVLMGLPEEHPFRVSEYAHTFGGSPALISACEVQSYCHQCLPIMEALGRAWNFTEATVQLRRAHRQHLDRLVQPDDRELAGLIGQVPPIHHCDVACPYQRTPTSLAPAGTTLRDLGRARDVFPPVDSAWI